MQPIGPPMTVETATAPPKADPRPRLPVNGGATGQPTNDSHRLLHVLLDHFPGGVCLFDCELRLVLHNMEYRRLLELPDSLFSDGPPDMEKIFRFNADRGEYGTGDTDELVLKRLELARKKVAHTYDRKRPNGTILEVRGVPIDGGGFITTYVDVTKQRQRMRTLEAIVENFPGGICLFDEADRMVLHNAELRRLLNYTDDLFENEPPTLEQLFWYNAERGEYGTGDPAEHVRRRLALVQKRLPHTYERTRPNGTVVEVRGDSCGRWRLCYILHRCNG